ncbi:hypothetical protein [Halobacillus naozhouensis]|uniref:Uncharacterized protein n=1 Tax=Halobacillus naozhouensis TaxID=554880 RepID=A0ABY8IXV9_9BACI|nr:hypothetical protein [Halobacillus naozhouensis]WFT74187.1 hypothetical protein P9989_17755 [Halobacillus naozhouensis]
MMALPITGLLITLTTKELAVVIHKLVAEAEVKKDYKKSKRYLSFRYALRVSLGVLIMIGTLVGAKHLAPVFFHG